MADLFLFNDVSSVTAIEGQCVIQPTTGQTWAYLGTQWTPVTGGDPFSFGNPLSVFIGGNLRNANIKYNSLVIQDNLTNKVDLCSFILWDDGESGAKPILGQSVDIFEYSTSTKIFGGEISAYTQEQEIIGNHERFIYKISCVDYSKRLHKRLITESYENEKAGDIIKDIINNYFTEFSTINVEDGPTIDYVEFNYTYADEAIRKIVKLSNYDWYVDTVKDIHFFQPSTDYAPYTITKYLGENYNSSTDEYTISSNNKYLDYSLKFNNQSSFTNYTATVAEGSYPIGADDTVSGSLCEAIRNAFLANLHDVNTSFTDGIFKITFVFAIVGDQAKLLFGSGTNVDNSIAYSLGYQNIDYDIDFPVVDAEGTYNLNNISGHYCNLKIKEDKTRYRNTIYLQGSGFLEQFDNDIQVADGEQTTFSLAYEPYDTTEVYVDTGAGYIQKTLGIDGTDTSGYDFVLNRTEKTVRNLDLATLSDGDIIKVTYKKKIKLIVSGDDTTSISDIQAKEGGDGVYEYKIIDDTFETTDAARDRITSELTDYKDPVVTGSFSTDQFGYKAGQVLKLNMPTWGYGDAEYKIDKVKYQILANPGLDDRAYLRLTISFSTYDEGWNEFVLGMYNNSTNRTIIVKGDEKVTT